MKFYLHGANAGKTASYGGFQFVEGVCEVADADVSKVSRVLCRYYNAHPDKPEPKAASVIAGFNEAAVAAEELSEAIKEVVKKPDTKPAESVAVADSQKTDTKKKKVSRKKK